MSLIPISEAIQRLVSEGLLESKPQVGTRVRIPSEQDVRGRFIVREALEGQAARLFAEGANFHQRQELKLMAEHLDTLYGRLAASNGDTEFAFAVHSYHFQFHMRIAESSGCVALQDMIQKNSVLIFNWLFDVTGHQIARSSRFHQELADILAGTDPDAAQAASRAHVRYGIEEIVAGIKLMQPTTEPKWRSGRAKLTSQAPIQKGL